MGVTSTYRQLLRNGPLTRLLIGEFVSSIGDWLYLVALVVLVYRETENPVLLGIVGAARLLPYVFLSIPAGIVGDRFDRRYVLLVSDVVRAGCMVVLAILVTVDAPIWAIAAVAILAACFAPFFYPAFGALLPSLVRDEREFGPANSAWATLDNLAWVVGPGIAGVIIATGGLQIAFVINAVSFIVIGIVLVTLPKATVAAPRSSRRGPRLRGSRSRWSRSGARPTIDRRPPRHPAGQAPGVPGGYRTRSTFRPSAASSCSTCSRGSPSAASIS